MRASGGHDARRARTAICVVRTSAARLDALRAGAHVRRHRAGDGVRHARHTPATIGARRAGATGVHTSPGAPGNADVVLFARVLGLAIAAAAIARRITRRRLEFANVTVRLAAHRVATHTDCARGRDDARDGLARTPGQPFRSAAVAVLRAQVADDVAAACGLAHEHSRGSPGRARAAATRPATKRQGSALVWRGACGPRPSTELSVGQAAVRRPAGRRTGAGADHLPGRHRAPAGAAAGAG